MLWAHYRKTFLRTQLIILGLGVLLYFVAHATLSQMLVPLLVMEAGALYGVRVAGIVKRKMEPRPLRPLIRNG